ncbi:PREDICTED: uncharacterized protein LOC104763654 [Camelina sativa]|uniref:Uncharacterized protein LOC104763654 n=1 Tax=Camelina sativa TaxID=90675 RepID=A0ABM0XFM4_CAMSA|nr:PREDICTED: uncharacterized protein LOC104763654 [Camelina sativa]
MVLLLLKDIVPAVQNNNGKNSIALAADETAAVHIQLWGDECEEFEAGDIVKLIREEQWAHPQSWEAWEDGQEFTVAFVETPNISEIQWIPDPENPKRYIQSAVVSAYSQEIIESALKSATEKGLCNHGDAVVALHRIGAASVIKICVV